MFAVRMNETGKTALAEIIAEQGCAPEDVTPELCSRLVKSFQNLWDAGEDEFQLDIDVAGVGGIDIEMEPDWFDSVKAINSLEEYVPLALRTEALPTEGWRKEMGLDLYRVDHALRGLSTEIGEFCEALSEADYEIDCVDWVNLREEVGDMWWYVAILIYVLGMDSPPPRTRPAGESQAECISELLTGAADLVAQLGKAHDVIKNRINYNRPDHAKAEWGRVNVGGLAWLVRDLTMMVGCTDSELWERNIGKLMLRYPDVFDADLAVHRDLAAERELLER